MQEELERKSISVTVQATKLTGRVMKAAIAATLRKIEKERNTPKVGRNSMRRLTAQTPDAHKIEVEERIRSFERYAKKYRVHYHVEKDASVSPPKWTVYFKANQADAINLILNLIWAAWNVSLKQSTRSVPRCTGCPALPVHGASGSVIFLSEIPMRSTPGSFTKIPVIRSLRTRWRSPAWKAAQSREISIRRITGLWQSILNGPPSPPRR